MARRILTWIPRKYGSPLGFVTGHDGEILASNVRRAAAAGLFPNDRVTYDTDGMTRQLEDGTTLAQRIADGFVETK